MSQLNLYGPPGSGKSRQLTKLFISSSQQAGPQAVAAVTFTRTAAEELRQRVGAALGLQPNPRRLRAQIPWVGTIHSLCYKLLGLNQERVVSTKKLRDWASNVGFTMQKYQDEPLWNDEIDTAYPSESVQRGAEVDLMRLALGMSRHRMIPLEEVWELLPGELTETIGFGTIERMIREYTTWKQDESLYDFEDMLEQGREMPLPVKVLLCDEVQDNSPLLWSVIDRWKEHTQLAVMAGDPYQAIYLFAGADPDLFRNQPGQWKTIGDCHRFDDATAQYAKNLLVREFDADELLGTWHGVGGEKRDGTAFVLARTHTLVATMENHLREQGVPYTKLRGKGPIERLAGRVYAGLAQLRDPNATLPVELLQDLVSEATLTGAQRRNLGLKVRKSGLALVDREDVEQIFGAPLDAIMVEWLEDGEYFRAVEQRFGLPAFTSQPVIATGTIHAAKGREADRVVL